MCSHKIPSPHLCTCFQPEALLESTVGLICGNDKILVDSIRSRNLLYCQHTLVENSYIRDYKTDRSYRILYCIPYCIFRVMEFYGKPSTRLQYSISLCQAI